MAPFTKAGKVSDQTAHRNICYTCGKNKQNRECKCHHLKDHGPRVRYKRQYEKMMHASRKTPSGRTSKKW